MGASVSVDPLFPNQVVVCVCTYKRTVLLGELLPELARQIRSFPEWNIRLIVIDNDEARTAESRVAEFGSEYPDISLKYLCEPTAGVGNARNAAIESIRKDEALIFFDDDQRPSLNWLQELLVGHSAFPDDVLVGPVIPLLPAGAPLWSQGAWAWGRRELPDGTLRRNAGFGNILIPARAIASGLCEIPANFLRGMGEDTLVTTKLGKAGFAIRQVAAAVAHEPVSNERLTVDWVRQRARISGETWVRVVRATDGSRLVLGASMLKQIAAWAMLKMLAVVLSNPTYQVRAAVTVSRLRGYVHGIYRR